MRLRTSGQRCEFHDTDFESEEQIILGGNSAKIWKRALRDPDFDLKAMLLEGRRDEQSAFQANDIEAKEAIVVETNQMETKNAFKCYYFGRESTPVTVHAMEKERKAFIVVKEITFPMFAKTNTHIESQVCTTIKRQ